MKNLNREIFIIMTLLLQILGAREVCQFQYTGTLDSLKGNTLILPNETVAMQQEVILESFIDEIEEARPVSLFIIMDQTASMGAQDPNGNRHKALAKILAAIEERSPDSEIGGAFFGNDLGLDTADDQLFASSPHSSKGYGYIPFLKVNENYESDNYGICRGIDQFRNFFQLSDTSLNHLEWEVNHGPGADTTWKFFFNYTNIDAPFLAAREAFKNANNPVKDQYIIFFSDGGDNCGSTQFTTGEATPTTFSVFITSTTNPTYNIIPLELDTMINNIKNNGYSSSNIFSEIWAVNTEDEVMVKVDSAILEVVIKNKTVTPDTIKINGMTSIGNWDSTGLSLEGPVPLTEIPDTFIQVLSYESVEIVNTDTTIEQVIDTSEFYIDRSDINQSVNVSTFWWDRELQFYNKNDYSIEIDSIRDSLGILFTQNNLDNVYQYDSVTINLSSSSGDQETLELNSLNDSFSVVIPLSFSVASLNNQALECGNVDTITVFYQNPQFPLDTLTTKIVLNKPDEVLADAFLSASPGDTIYQTSYLDVLLETDSGNIIVYEVLNMDSTLVSGPDTIVNSGLVKVSGNVIIKATATGVNFNSKDSSWVYKCELPYATLLANPGDAVYNTLEFNVELSTDSGNIIVYEFLNTDSATIFGPDTINTKGTIIVSGDIIVKATAIGENYTAKDSLWFYDCELPQLTLKSNIQNETSFTLDTTVYLTALFEDVEVDAKIYYIISYSGSGNMPDSVTGIAYDSLTGINISKSAKVYAVAYNENYLTAYGVWGYNLSLLDIDITVTPSEEPYYGIGYKLDSIQISTTPMEGISVTWLITNDSIVDSVSIISNGKVWNGTDFPTITTDSLHEYYYLHVMATGDGYNSIIETFVYKRQKLPEIVAIPYDAKGYKFSDNINVLLSLEDSLKVFKNVKIHYFLDTVEYGVQASVKDSGYSNPVNIIIDTTIYIKAIATAENAISSEFFIGYYILETGVTCAWYKDYKAGESGDSVDGVIDVAIIELNKSTAILPDSVMLVSPFDTSEKIIVTKSDLAFDSLDAKKIIAPLSKSFVNKSHDVNTLIDAAVTPNLGTLYGRYYSNNSFNIKDSVKPLINSALFLSGDYELQNDSVKVYPDTIIICFSESVEIDEIDIGNINPASFYSISDDEMYTMLLDYVSKNSAGNEYRFIVNHISNAIIPAAGDSLRVNVDFTVSDKAGNVQSIEGNRYGYIRYVSERTYPYTLKALSPVNPSTCIIPDEIKANSTYPNRITSGLMVIADFYTVVNTDEMQMAEAVVYDQLGNIIASADSYGDFENMAIDIITFDGLISKTIVAFLWDGTNMNGRYVGSGSYIIQISFTDPSGNKISEKLQVGVVMKN